MWRWNGSARSLAPSLLNTARGEIFDGLRRASHEFSVAYELDRTRFMLRATLTPPPPLVTTRARNDDDDDCNAAIAEWRTRWREIMEHIGDKDNGETTLIVVDAQRTASMRCAQWLARLVPYFAQHVRWHPTCTEIVLDADGFAFDDFAMVWRIKVRSPLTDGATERAELRSAYLARVRAGHGEALLNAANFLGIAW